MESTPPNFESSLVEARRRFFHEGKLPAGVVSERIGRSWERARTTFGLNRNDRRVFNLITPQRRSLIEERSRTVVAHALPELEKLHAFLGHGGWAIAFADCEGIVVRSLCGSGPEFRELASILEVGRDISEASLGTNGPGCALADRLPIVIRSSEHFLDEISPFDCAAVPVFGPDGRILGVLDATRHRSRKAATVLEAMGVAASVIENKILCSAAPDLIIAIHYHEALLDSPGVGLLGFDEDGYLAGANQVARRLLGIAVDQPLPRFDELFDITLSGFRRRVSSRHGKILRLHTVDRLVLAARVLPAATARRSTANAVSPALSGTPDGLRPLGDDPRVVKSFDLALRAYERSIPVLINGETGTGKEVLARRLHECGSAATEPFIPINCAAIPANLIESEFFGYEDGAFTGGKRGGTAGKFEMAKGGTLFLDEIGDMPMELQGRLLRVLQERCFFRVGGTTPVPFAARVIAATHRNLEDSVDSGRFRQDLYYRIQGVRVVLPPLREREDLSDLIRRMVDRECAGEARVCIADEVWDFLLGHAWPGNLRQLEHALRVALVFRDEGEPLRLKHFPADLLDTGSGHRKSDVTDTGAGTPLREAELIAVRAAMAMCNGNVSAAARRLGIARATLYRKLRLIKEQHRSCRDS